MAKSRMIDRILSDENMETAKQRLFHKIGDTELSTEEIEAAFAQYRKTKERIRKEILNMSWKPEPVKAVHIRKKDGSKRVVMVLLPLDRLIQEATAEVLDQMLKPSLSKSVYQFDQFMGVRKPGKYASASLQKAGPGCCMLILKTVPKIWIVWL